MPPDPDPRLQAIEESLAALHASVNTLAGQVTWLVEQANVALQGLAQSPLTRGLFRTKTN